MPPFLILAGLLSCALLWAAPPAEPKPAGDPPPNPGGGAGVQLTDVNFPQMLKDLGYKVETKKNTNNEDYWIIHNQQDSWGYVVEVQPQRSKATKRIVGFWLISDLGGKLDKPGALSAAALLKLLEKSHEMAPYFFSYNAATKHLAMNFEYPSGTIDQETLKKQFANLFGKIRGTHELWKMEVLVGGNPGPDPKPNPDPPKPATDLAETQWKGTETLPGYGPLTFKLNKGGQAIMIDKDGAAPGTWTQSGNEVTLKFGNGGVTYKGTISGAAMSGTGQNAQTSWTFTLKKE